MKKSDRWKSTSTAPALADRNVHIWKLSLVDNSDVFSSDSLSEDEMNKGKWRYYTVNDVKWIECLREMIHEHGISIAAVKKLLQYTPCWNITDWPFEKRKQCIPFMSNGLIPKKIDMDKPRKVAHLKWSVA